VAALLLLAALIPARPLAAVLLRDVAEKVRCQLAAQHVSEIRAPDRGLVAIRP
jgi:hypothetical protein